MNPENRYIYKLLYKLSKDIITKVNICEHRDGMCLRERDRHRRGMKVNKYCCCGDPNGKASIDVHCKYWTNKGCTVQNLDCMLWLCKIADEKMKTNCPDEWAELQSLRVIARRYNFLKGRELLF